MPIEDRIDQGDPLPQLVNQENFVGWVYYIDYENASIMTNDLLKARVNGVPHNSFIVAASFVPTTYAQTRPAQKEVVVLRVVGSAKLPMDDDLVRTNIEHLQERGDSLPQSGGLDNPTGNQVQFSGLQCRVLGTFYTNGNGRLCLGSDLETYHSAVQLQVYKPRGGILEKIVNYISPVRELAARKDAERLGLQELLPAFSIGEVRYTSSNRLQLADTPVVFKIRSVDFLSKRTAVFGTRRTGKSNMIKQLVSVVKRTTDQTGIRIGQIIYDFNGEYANTDQQDAGSLAAVYRNQTERYRMLPAPGFHLIRNNFYNQLVEGFALVQLEMSELPARSLDMKAFLNVSFEEPDAQDKPAHNCWLVKKAIYQAMLYKAGFPPPHCFTIAFPANNQVRHLVDPNRKFSPPQHGLLRLSPAHAVTWFEAARAVNRKIPLLSTSGTNKFDEDAIALLNMLAGKNSNEAYITGYKHLNPLKEYHSPDRTHDVSEEIYQFLKQGKIVILDLSIGNPDQRTRLGKVIAKHLFNRSMGIFNKGDSPPNIVIYLEEAHNFLGRRNALTDTWPRIANEGPKFRIATVYANQEVSSIHPNILSNTENIFALHINDEPEVRELSKFYDFNDFAKSLIRAQDVGFARVKTVSSPFAVPVQIHRFDPDQECRLAGSSDGSVISREIFRTGF